MYQIKIISQWLCFFSFFIGIAACNSSEEKVPDVSAIKVVVKTNRLDQDMLKLDTNNLAAGLVELNKKYPEFLNFYLDTIKGLGINHNYDNANPAVNEGLRSFFSIADYRNLFDTINAHYPNTEKIDADLTKGFQYLKHYYPAYKIPPVVYFNSFLANWGVVFDGKTIGVGLDMFLGANYPYYTSVGQPEYMFINFRPESIVPSVFSTIYTDIHPYEDEEKTLLDLMIQKGKQQYFIQKMLPFTTVEDRLGYTKDQLKWAEQNEAMIYNFFLDNNLMFEKNWTKMRRFVVYGPNTAGMPAESPGNIGTWLGLQIVKAYAKENPSDDLDKMFNDKNAEQFLRKAKYKPKN